MLIMQGVEGIASWTAKTTGYKNQLTHVERVMNSSLSINGGGSVDKKRIPIKEQQVKKVVRN
ncbi:hypothetical protein KHA80_19605 [Anaerobacillus sp. HL2]|nr:hypothetical protein KHA80_19605 [Anaerobacillus sp. HL2]